MEKYKHACPVCGQHIEYTAEYCGKQITCPTCQKPVLFPALPPASATQKLRLQRDARPRKRRSFFNLPFLRALAHFEHWKLVWAGAIPFLLVAGLLLGAVYLRNSSGNEAQAAIPKAVSGPVGQDAWTKMTDLGAVEQQVQHCIAMAVAQKAALAQAERESDLLQQTHKNGAQDETTMQQFHAATLKISRAQQQLGALRQSFDVTFEKYQKLGGQIDYRSQFPN